MTDGTMGTLRSKFNSLRAAGVEVAITNLDALRQESPEEWRSLCAEASKWPTTTQR